MVEERRVRQKGCQEDEVFRARERPLQTNFEDKLEKVKGILCREEVEGVAGVRD